MDLSFDYSGQIPRDVDILNPQVQTLVAMAHLSQDVLFNSVNPLTAPNTYSTMLAGFDPSYNSNMTVTLAAGRIYTMAEVAQNAFSDYNSGSPDSRQVLQQGQADIQTLTFAAAPSTSGYSRIDLVQVSFSETDTDNIAVQYYNSANPAQPLNGPGGSGTTQPLVRTMAANVSVVTGTAAASPTAPSPSAGATGMFYVTVAYGQTSITSADVSLATNAPFLAGSNQALQAGKTFTSGVTIQSGGLTVSAGTTAVQALTAASLTLTTPLGTAYGGTGQSNAAGVGQNAVWAGPASGGAGAASYRALQPADLPVGSATQLGALEVGSNISVAGGVISIPQSVATSASPTFSGMTLTAGLTATAANQVAEFLSGSATTNAYLYLGRTAGDGLWGIAGSAGQMLADAAQGDVIFRVENSANAIRLGPAGGVNSWAALNSSGMTLEGTFTLTASVSNALLLQTGSSFAGNTFIEALSTNNNQTGLYLKRNQSAGLYNQGWTMFIPTSSTSLEFWSDNANASVFSISSAGAVSMGGLAVSSGITAGATLAALYGPVFAFTQDINSGYLGANFGGGGSSSSGNYIKNQYATRLMFDSAAGAINLQTAPSGTAGGAVTFTTQFSIANNGAASFESNNVTMGALTATSISATGAASSFGSQAVSMGALTATSISATGAASSFGSQAVSMGALTARSGTFSQSVTNGLNLAYVFNPHNSSGGDGAGIAFGVNSTNGPLYRLWTNVNTGVTYYDADATFDQVFRVNTGTNFGSATPIEALRLNGTTGDATFAGALTATSGTFNGNPSSSVNPLVEILPISTTNAALLSFANGGAGSFYVGMANSSGNSALVSSLTPYQGVIGMSGALPFSIITDGLERFAISSAGAADFKGNSVSMGALTATGNVSTSTFLASGVTALLGSGTTASTGVIYGDPGTSTTWSLYLPSVTSVPAGTQIIVINTGNVTSSVINVTPQSGQYIFMAGTGALAGADALSGGSTLAAARRLYINDGSGWLAF